MDVAKQKTFLRRSQCRVRPSDSGIKGKQHDSIGRISIK